MRTVHPGDPISQAGWGSCDSPARSSLQFLPLSYGLLRVVIFAEVRPPLGRRTEVREPPEDEGRTTLGAVIRVGELRGTENVGLLGCIRLLVDGVTRLCRVGCWRDDDVVLGRAVVVVRAGVVTLERRVDVTGVRELVWRTGRACADDELVERWTGLTRSRDVERVVVAVGVTRLAVD